jgi:hypothetical protein
MVIGPFSPSDEAKRLAAQTQIAETIKDAERNSNY